MANLKMAAPFVTLTIEASSAPLHRRLYEAVRLAILSGQFGANARLPSTRALATQLGVSRMTICAYEQLLIEGYIEGKVGAGTYVASSLPEELLQTQRDRSRQRGKQTKPSGRRIMRHGTWVGAAFAGRLDVLVDRKARAFQTGMPDVESFPFDVWSRLAARRYKSPPRALLDAGEPAGYRPYARQSLPT